MGYSFLSLIIGFVREGISFIYSFMRRDKGEIRNNNKSYYNYDLIGKNKRFNNNILFHNERDFIMKFKINKNFRNISMCNNSRYYTNSVNDDNKDLNHLKNLVIELTNKGDSLIKDDSELFNLITNNKEFLKLHLKDRLAILYPNKKLRKVNKHGYENFKFKSSVNIQGLVDNDFIELGVKDPKIGFFKNIKVYLNSLKNQ
jgi:hypothetical protein